VTAGGLAWVHFTLNRETPELYELPVPTALVPHLGHIVMALMTVKLFGRRSTGDFWTLQGMGLLQVSVGCVLATEEVFGWLLLVALLLGLACLVLHFLPAESAAAGQSGAVRLPARFPLGRFTLRWFGGVAAVALPAFLVAPRGEGPVWDPLSRFTL